MVREVLLILSASKTLEHRSKTGSKRVIASKSFFFLSFMAFLSSGIRTHTDKTYYKAPQTASGLRLLPVSRVPV